MRALVLAAGKGSRLGPVTSRQNKCLLKCGGRPIIDLVVASAAHIAEITEIVLVVGYRSDDVVRHFREHPAGKPVRFVHQVDQRGLVDAIECARPWVDDDEVLLLLGDEVVVGARYREFIEDFRTNGFYASVGSLPTSDPARVRKTYTFSYDDARRVRRLVEKPTVVLSPRMGTGAVLFSVGALSYAELTDPHPARGEKDLVGVLQAMVDRGRVVSWFDVCDDFANVNTADELLDARVLAEDGARLAEAS